MEMRRQKNLDQQGHTINEKPDTLKKIRNLLSKVQNP